MELWGSKLFKERQHEPHLVPLLSCQLSFTLSGFQGQANPRDPWLEPPGNAWHFLTWISVRAGTRNRSSLLVHLPIDHETKKIWSTFTLLDRHDFWIDAISMPGILPRPGRPHPTIICVWLHTTMTTPSHSLCMTTQTLDVISPAEPMNRCKTLKKKIY